MAGLIFTLSNLTSFLPDNLSELKQELYSGLWWYISQKIGCYFALWKSIDATKTIQVMSDGPMVFLILLCERRVDEELSWLIGLSTCGMQFYTADSSMMKKQVAARDLKGT